MTLKTLIPWLRPSKAEAKRPIEALASDLALKHELNGSNWRHKKGGQYKIICIAYRETTLELEVVYQDVQNPVRYIRPLAEFMDGRFTRL